MEQAKGKAKERGGKATRDNKTEAEGKVEDVKGQSAQYAASNRSRGDLSRSAVERSAQATASAKRSRPRASLNHRCAPQDNSAAILMMMAARTPDGVQAKAPCAGQSLTTARRA